MRSPFRSMRPRRRSMRPCALPHGGEEAFFAMLDFARHMRPLVRDTRLTVVDVIGEEAVAQARELARRLDMPLHVRHYQGPEGK